jgi:hypothetical protein
VVCFEGHDSEVAFSGQQLWNTTGNQLAEAHTQTTETKLLQIGIYFVVLL